MKSIYYACVTLLLLSLCLTAGNLSAADLPAVQPENRILHVCSSGIRNNACDRTSKRSPLNAAGQSSSLPDIAQVKPDYMTNVEGKISSFFILPSGFYKDMSAIVTFRISKDGNVYRKNLEKKSCNYTFDSTALQAIEASSPFSPPPRELTGVEIRVTFHP